MHTGPASESPPAPSAGAGPPRWVLPAVCLLAALFAAGAVIALVRPGLLASPGADVDAATRVYAGYLASRDAALALALVTLLVLRARQMLAAALLLAALIQLVDVVVDATTGRLVLVPGLVVLAAVMLASATRSAPRPLWRISSWRDAS
jgi:hypothetical protein